MKTTVQFLDAVRARYGLTSDYQLAKLLGLKQQAISHYRKGRTWGAETAVKVAELLKLPAVYVLACMAAERAGTVETRNAWSKAARVLAGTAVAILAGCTLAMVPLPHLVP